MASPRPTVWSASRATTLAMLGPRRLPMSTCLKREKGACKWSILSMGHRRCIVRDYRKGPRALEMRINNVTN